MEAHHLAEDWDEDDVQESEPEKHVMIDTVVDRGQEPLRIDKYLMVKIGASPAIKYNRVLMMNSCR